MTLLAPALVLPLCVPLFPCRDPTLTALPFVFSLHLPLIVAGGTSRSPLTWSRDRWTGGTEPHAMFAGRRTVRSPAGQAEIPGDAEVDERLEPKEPGRD